MKTTQSNTTKNVVVIGAGPVGIAAAAHLIERGQTPIVLEKGHTVGSAMLEWGHVQLFSPWKYATDKAVIKLLEKQGWQHPDKEQLPKGRDIVEQYLQPAAQTPELQSVIKLGVEVTAISKENHSKHTSTDRDNADYFVHYRDSEGESQIIHADSIIDASGTWSAPNPIGLDGLPVPGEEDNSDSIAYGIPDVLNTARKDYAGKRTLVIGAGHSAINVALELLKLQGEEKATKILWGLRKNNLEKLLGGGINDELPARGELGIAAKRAIDSGALELLTGLNVKKIAKVESGLAISIIHEGMEQTIDVDRIVVATGFRPNLQMLREVRLDIDHIVEAPSILAPLIDPNHHSCGTVKPHGVEELTHHDKGFYIVGMKSYGRAPTFLMLTGYEQVRSIAAELAGDFDSARRVELVLPQTGVCSSKKSESATSCCGTEAVEESTSCCAPAKEAIPEELPSLSAGCCAPAANPQALSCCG
ncbi:MAG: NAD(P)-binding domain-containing protein [Cellvibrionales bacterium]|nr:NAD(P)-binding domain-containing protein [Cellvibrionales bacterium]